MWSYIHYFIYLSNTSPNDYTALDAYVARKVSVNVLSIVIAPFCVHRQRLKEEYDFFPTNEALSLASSKQTAETNKIDVVAKQVQFLIDIHKKEVRQVHTLK
jgi:inositol 1,4,5-triphosphate receptor type 1